MKLIVAGMTCAHCVQTITRAIQTLQPASRIGVDRDAGTVSIDGEVDAAPAAAAIEAEGYRGSQPAVAWRRKPRRRVAALATEGARP